MKATFEFDLPDDLEAYEIARRAPDYAAAFEALANKVRDRLKYETPRPDGARELEALSNYIAELRSDYDLKV